MHPIHASKTLVYLGSILVLMKFHEIPRFEIHFMGAKVPCQPSDRPALGTSQGTAPEEEAAAHPGDRH